MPNVIVVGAQWGDEGKAKITDLLAMEADVVVRSQGGCNAGHTVKFKDDVFKFHLIPSGLLYPQKLCIIGPGTVIDPSVLLQEIERMTLKGYSVQNLKISSRAHLTLPHHIRLDKAQEASLSSNKIGTTGRGIGPTYMDKVARLGIRMGDLYLPTPVLQERLKQVAQAKRLALASLSEADPAHADKDLSDWVSEWLAYCQQYAEKLKPFVADTVYLLHQEIRNGKRILFEGAQGTLLDVDYGTYPFVTSSNSTAGGACTGSGVGPTRIDRVIGVMKAYTTRVGEGPFPTEMDTPTAQRFAEVGQEYGTTTGRLRRCGWFDAVIGKYSVLVNGLDSLAITKLDVLDGLDEIQLATAYRHRETGEIVDQFPADIFTLKELEPIYETFPGWPGESVKEARTYEELPIQARQYLERIAALLEVPIALISIGAERNQTIVIDHPVSEKRPVSPYAC